MSQLTLTGEPVKPKRKYQWRKTRRIDTVWENCINCGEELKFAIYEDPEEFDAETHRPLWKEGTFIHGEARCKCGAELLIADDLEHTNMYWLNRKEMEALNGGKPT